jgi:hypothetical protein
MEADVTTTTRDRGWYPDPAGSRRDRYWDGSEWTVHYAAPRTWLDRKLAPAGGHENPMSNKRVAVYLAVIVAVIAAFLAPYAAMSLAAQRIGSGLQLAFTPVGKGVIITSCAPPRNGRMAITGTAHNGTQARSDFLIGVTVSDASGSQISEANAIASNVAPGKTAPWTTTTPANAAGLTCELSTVFRAQRPLF